MKSETALRARRRGVLGWTLRILRVIQFVMVLVFVAYFVCVQINAVAYLAGRSKALIPGAAPPVALHSGMAAAADILAGLVFEAVAALIIFIALAVGRSAIRNRRASFIRPWPRE
jgi:hypothetical protein